MKSFHPAVQGHRTSTCRLQVSKLILTCRLFDFCQEEGKLGSIQIICRHSFHHQMLRNMQVLISLSDAILQGTYAACQSVSSEQELLVSGRVLFLKI
jgi:hypothetical protein